MSKKKKHKRSGGKNASFSLTKDIISVFRKNPKKPLNHKQVSSSLGIKNSSGKTQVIKALHRLVATEKLDEVAPGKFKLIFQGSVLEGKIDITRSGSAYVMVDGFDDDVYISPKNMNAALHNDIVRINLFAVRKGKKIQGEVVEILQRAKTDFVGIVEVVGKFAFLVPDSPKMHVDLFIDKSKLNGAKHGQKAIARMTDWPPDASSPFGEIVEVLGAPGEHDVEMSSILSENGFPPTFPEEVEAEAAKIPTEITKEEISARRDFRNITTFTIDPIDAKDFDDALSFQKLENGNLEVGVHIADVTHYVKEGAMIDKEAVSRATSVYLVDRVIPMLPEVLSNQVCSLRPKEEKLCFSAVFEMTTKGKVINSWVGRTVIYSDRRFHYDEVQDILEAGEGELFEELSALNSIAKIMREKRMGSGAIAFNKVEVRFTLNDNKKPVGVRLKVQKDAHKLIEEFMLLANRTVAEKIGKPTNKEKPKTFVYRIHDTPDQEKLSDFANFIKKFGYQFTAKQPGDISKSLNSLLHEVEGKKEENVISTLAIRSMAKAEYSTQNIGHYGLAFDYYSHFTSPIRRYPDMMAHRLLARYEKGGSSADQEHYEHLCKHSSEMERQAADAERDSIKYYQVLFMQDSIGKDYKGVVTGVTDFGIFVEIAENKCEGMIRLRDIDDDYYVFDEENFRIIGHNYNRVINLGDELMIRVKKADLMRRQLDFELLEEEE